MTSSDLAKLGFILMPDGSYSHPKNILNINAKRLVKKAASEACAPRLHNPVTQRPSGQTLDGNRQGKAKSKKRIVCRITRFANKLLDADNFAGGCKPLIDQLRYAKLIPDDDPETIELQFAQCKITGKSKRTEIEIYEH